MLKALVIKELRESAAIVAVGLLGALYTLAMLTGIRFVPYLLPYWQGSNGLAFVSDNFPFALALLIGGVAVALGLKQSALEAHQGTYYFLLHRPATRRFLFSTKLATGIAIVLGIGGLMVLLYALWASTPGNTATPFFWSMTVPAWQLCLCMSLVYLGAFLSGIRPARWYGTRLVPLVAAGWFAFFAALISGFWLAAIAVLLSAVLFIGSIFFYARYRDY